VHESEEEPTSLVAAKAKANGEGVVDHDTPTPMSGSEMATGGGGALDATEAAAAVGRVLRPPAKSCATGATRCSMTRRR